MILVPVYVVNILVSTLAKCSLVRDQVGHRPEHREAGLTLVHQVDLLQQNLLDLTGAALQGVDDLKQKKKFNIIQCKYQFSLFDRFRLRLV